MKLNYLWIIKIYEDIFYSFPFRVQYSLGPASLPFRWGCWRCRAGDCEGGVWPLPHISGVVRHPAVRTTLRQSRGGLYTQLYPGHLQSRPGFTGTCMSGLTWQTYNISYNHYNNGVCTFMMLKLILGAVMFNILHAASCPPTSKHMYKPIVVPYLLIWLCLSV